MKGRHFLLMYCDWSIRESVEQHAPKVAEILRLPLVDVSMRLKKPGLTLLASGVDPDPLSRSAGFLRLAGYKAIVVGEEYLSAPLPANWAVSAGRQGTSVQLLDREGRPVLEVDERSRLLVVLGDLDVRRDDVGWWLEGTEQDGLDRRLSSSLGGRTILWIGEETKQQVAFFVEANVGDWSMETGSALSAAGNLRAFLALLQTTAEAFTLDVDFGLADTLPVGPAPVDFEAENAMISFYQHALMTFTLWRGGMLEPAPAVDDSGALPRSLPSGDEPTPFASVVRSAGQHPMYGPSTSALSSNGPSPTSASRLP